jgi:hypothetical protein
MKEWAQLIHLVRIRIYQGCSILNLIAKQHSLLLRSESSSIMTRKDKHYLIKVSMLLAVRTTNMLVLWLPKSKRKNRWSSKRILSKSTTSMKLYSAVVVEELAI